jgi:hypothetical protein
MLRSILQTLSKYQGITEQWSTWIISYIKLKQFLYVVFVQKSRNIETFFPHRSDDSCLVAAGGASTFSARCLSDLAGTSGVPTASRALELHVSIDSADRKMFQSGCTCCTCCTCCTLCTLTLQSWCIYVLPCVAMVFCAVCAQPAKLVWKLPSQASQTDLIACLAWTTYNAQIFRA